MQGLKQDQRVQGLRRWHPRTRTQTASTPAQQLFFLVGVEHIMHYGKAVKTALRSRTACTTLLVFIFFTNLFLDFKNIKKMTPSHQNSNCFHTCASILFWEGIVHDGTVVHIPVFILFTNLFLNIKNIKNKKRWHTRTRTQTAFATEHHARWNSFWNRKEIFNSFHIHLTGLFLHNTLAICTEILCFAYAQCAVRTH